MLRGLDDGARAIAALDDDLRRGLYRFVREQRRPVSREEAATAVGISRKLAAFHLDKLVDRGLLEFEYARTGSRTGRGAGRSSKLYRPAAVEIDVSVPVRRYDLAGSLLVKAISEEGRDERAADAAVRVARREGAEVGDTIRQEAGLRPPGAERALSVAEDALARYGYEPYREERGQVALANCPFHVLSRESTELVCGMNRAFIEGLVRGLGKETLQIALEPAPGRCCVKLRIP
jgi:predicted ArsR family transcriptional regulator